MEAFWAWLWGTGWFWFALFWVALFVNGRAAFKLLLDWKGMLTTCRFVERAYATQRLVYACNPINQKRELPLDSSVRSDSVNEWSPAWRS